MRNIHQYDDIIDFQRPESGKHPKMPISDRAAQFSPFAALSGFEEVLKSEAHFIEENIDSEQDIDKKANHRL